MTAFRLSFLLVLALAVSACDTLTEPAPGHEFEPVPEPQPRMVTLNIAMDRIYIEGDCDVAGINNAGEFEFDVTEDVQTMVSYTNRSVYHGTPKLVHGKHVGLSSRSRSFEIAEDRVGFVTLGFEATEWDKDFAGGDLEDADMKERSGSVSHRFRNGAWSNLGRKTIRLGSKSSCRVELRYTASVTS